MSLQDDKTAVTRERIMRGLAEEIIESGPHEVSIQDVADRAGVSHRTVYRYFESKDELFNAYGTWLDDLMSEEDQETAPRSLDGLEERIVDVYRTFDEYEELVEALVRIGADGHDVEARRRRTRAFAEAIGSAVPDVDDAHQKALATMVRQIASSQTWSRGRRAHALDGDALGEVALWLLETLQEALEEEAFPDSWKRED